MAHSARGTARRPGPLPCRRPRCRRAFAGIRGRIVSLAADLAIGLDPVQLATRAGFTLDPWQAQVLRSDAPHIALNCCRQAGKSTVSALAATHTALYTPGALVLLLSPSLRQSQE